MAIDGDTALRLAGMKLGDRALIGPEMVHLDLTDTCPNNCIGCWARSPFLRDGDHYDTLELDEHAPQFVFDLIPRLRDLRVAEVFLGGGGDPSCYKYLIDVVRWIKDAGMRCTVNTSFVCTNEAQLDALCDVGLDNLIVSVWAATGETYAKLHPNKSEKTFRIVTDLLGRLAARRAAGLRVPRVKIYNVVCSLNYREIPGMIAYGRDLGVEEVELSVMDPIPGRTSMFNLNESHIAWIDRWHAEFRQDNRPFVHTELMMRRLHNVDALKGVFDNGIVASIPCAAGWFFSRITTTGLVNACLKSHRIPSGQAKDGFDAAWFGEKHDEFRRHTIRIDQNDPWLMQIGHDINFPLPGCFRICDNLGHNQEVMRIRGGLSPEDAARVDRLAEMAKAGASREALIAASRGDQPGAAPTLPTVAATVITNDRPRPEPPLANGGPRPTPPAPVPEGFTPVAFVARSPREAPAPAKAQRPAAQVATASAVLPDAVSTVRVGMPFVSLAADIDLLHDHILGEGRRFTRTLESLRAAAPGDRIRVPLLPDNIFRLPKIAALIEESTGRRAPNAEMLALSVTPLDTLSGRVENFLAGARMVLDKIGVDLDPATRSLRECFARVASGDIRESERLRALGVVTNTALVGPRTFHLDVTNACNTDCVPCWFHSPLAKGRDDLGPNWKKHMLDWDVFTRLADDLAELHAGEDVVLSGKGEPTTHPRIADMVRYLKDRKLFTTLFTNGIRLTPELATTLVEAGCDLLYVSLMASDREVYRRTHPGAPDDEFDRVIANLETLMRIKGRDVSDKPEVVLVCVIGNRNVDDIVPFARLGARLGVDHLRYQLTAIEPYNRELALSDDELARVRNHVVEAKKVAEAAGIRVVENIDVQLAEIAQNWSGTRYLDDGCLVGWAFSRVWADGRVSYCCSPKIVHDVNTARFRDIWTGDDYDRARVAGKYMATHRDFRFANDKPLFDPICTRCPNYEGVERLREVLRETGLDAWL